MQRTGVIGDGSGGLGLTEKETTFTEQEEDAC